MLGSSDNSATIVPNGVDVDFWNRSTDRLGRNTIVFTGAMDYRPNADAATYLIRKIFPKVRATVSDVELLIVGRDPKRQLVDLGREPGVTVTGFCEDVRPYLERATVFVAPLRFGAGLQNKVLEAMAMGVPVLASPLTADGLRMANNQQAPLQVVQGCRQWADQIIQRLLEGSKDAAPDLQARRFVEKNFVWSQSGAKLNEIIHSVTNRHPGKDHVYCSISGSRRSRQVQHQPTA